MKQDIQLDALDGGLEKNLENISAVVEKFGQEIGVDDVVGLSILLPEEADLVCQLPSECSAGEISELVLKAYEERKAAEAAVRPPAPVAEVVEVAEEPAADVAEAFEADPEKKSKKKK